MAISAFEKEFTFDDFIKEKEEKEGKKKVDGNNSDQSHNEEEEEQVCGVEGWDRQWAERIFLETQHEVTKQIETLNNNQKYE